MSLSVSSYAGRLPLVSGRGAPAAVYELFTQLEPHLHLRAKLKAAARVGGRRWNLYFGNNVKVALPETDVEGALRWIERTDAEYGLLSKGLVSVDLRLEDRVAILPSPVENADGLKVSEHE
jgi:cell division protein FtsQ